VFFFGLPLFFFGASSSGSGFFLGLPLPLFGAGFDSTSSVFSSVSAILKFSSCFVVFVCCVCTNPFSFFT